MPHKSVRRRSRLFLPKQKYAIFRRHTSPVDSAAMYAPSSASASYKNNHRSYSSWDSFFQMICGKKFADEECLTISSCEASRITSVYCRLDSKVNPSRFKKPVDINHRRKFRLLLRKLGNLRAVHIHWTVTSSVVSRFAVNHFTNLEYLHLDGCPAAAIVGSFHIHLSRLIKLTMTKSDGLDLSRLLLPWKGEIENESIPHFPPMTSCCDYDNMADMRSCWVSLTTLRLVECGLTLMDKSLHFLPAVTEIDFSHNNVTQIIHLQDCSKLSSLDLSHNKVRVLSNLSRVLGNISSLLLSNNQVQSLDGIDKLYALQTLDVSNNLIDDFLELHYLTRLPCLEFLHLMGNPISLPKVSKNGKAPRVVIKALVVMFYRRLAFKNLLLDGVIVGAGRTLPILDGKPISNAQRQSFR